MKRVPLSHFVHPLRLFYGQSVTCSPAGPVVVHTEGDSDADWFTRPFTLCSSGSIIYYDRAVKAKVASKTDDMLIHWLSVGIRGVGGYS